MFSSLALLIGRRFSQAKQRNKMVSFISLSSTIGIAVGVAVIIIGLSAMNGFERELQSRVLSVIPHAELEGVRAPVENWQSVMTQAVANPKVVAAAPYVKFTGLVERGNKLKAVEVRGVEPDFEQAVSTMSQFIDQQAWSQFLPGQNQVIVGRGVANELGVNVGDYVTLLIPQTGESTKVQAPKRVRVKVTGMLTLNGQIDHNLVLLPMADAQQYNHLGEGVTGIALKTNDVLNAQAIVREVGRQIDVYVYLRSWQQQFGFFVSRHSTRQNHHVLSHGASDWGGVL